MRSKFNPSQQLQLSVTAYTCVTSYSTPLKSLIPHKLVLKYNMVTGNIHWGSTSEIQAGSWSGAGISLILLQSSFREISSLEKTESVDVFVFSGDGPFSASFL